MALVVAPIVAAGIAFAAPVQSGKAAAPGSCCAKPAAQAGQAKTCPMGAAQAEKCKTCPTPGAPGEKCKSCPMNAAASQGKKPAACPMHAAKKGAQPAGANAVKPVTRVADWSKKPAGAKPASGAKVGAVCPSCVKK